MTNPGQIPDILSLNSPVFIPHYEIKGRVYRDRNGNEIPSVTQIIRPLNAGYYSRIDRAAMREAARVGAAVHKAIARTLNGDNYDKWLDKASRPYFDAFKNWHKEHQIEAKVTEFNLGCSDFSGTLDCLAKIKNEWWVIEWKTTEKLLPSVAVQTAAYSMLARAWFEQHERKMVNIHRAALQLLPNGEWIFKEYNDISDYAIFNHLLAVKRWQMQHDE